MNNTIKVLNRELRDLRDRAAYERNTAMSLHLGAEIRRVENEIAELEALELQRKIWGTASNY